MFKIILAIHIIVAIIMIGLILIQHGKGADAGASFGSGSSGTIFGASGSGNFMTRLTTVLAITFFSTSLLLAIDARKESSSALILDEDVATESLFLDDNDSSDTVTTSSATKDKAVIDETTSDTNISNEKNESEVDTTIEGNVEK